MTPFAFASDTIPGILLGALLTAGITGLILLAATWAALGLLKGASAAVRHLAWFVGLVAMLVLPVLSAALPAWDVLPSWTLPPTRIANPLTPTIEEPRWLGGSTEPAAALETPAAPRRSADSPSSWAVIALVWACGAVLSLAPLIVGRQRLARLERRCVRVVDPDLLGLLDRCADSISLRHSPDLLVCDGPVMPMAWGIRRPRLVLPAEAVAWPEQRRRLVLLHELGHVVRRDCLIQLIATMIRSLYWFNPLVWVAVSRMQIEREIACDDLAMASGTPGPDYAEQLLAITASLSPAFGAAAGMAIAHHSRLEQRVCAALDRRRDRRRVDATRATAISILMLAAALPLACAGGANGVASSGGSKSVREATSSAVQPADEGTRLFASRLERVGAAINDGYIPAHNGHLPPDLGSVLAYIRPPGAPEGAPISSAAKGAVFLTPTDEKAIAVPAEPTPEWVNKNASIAYVGNFLSPHGATAVADWSTAVLAYSKLDHVKPSEPVLLLFLDGHVQVAGSRDDAQKIISASKAAATAALPEYLRCSMRLRSIDQAIMAYAYKDGHDKHLPPDLGSTFRYIVPTHWAGEDVPLATPAARARQYICPLDEKDLAIPADPTAAWVNEHASYVYLGDADISIDRIADWGTTVIAHDRLDHAHSNKPVAAGRKEERLVVLAFLDSHTEALVKEEAEKKIAESKKTLDAARDR